eukprot:SM000065S20258  [mRNA]  locus=s65:520709:524139:- [translate_table: standard]
MADGGGAVLLRHQRQLGNREPVGEGGVGSGGGGGGGAVGRLLAHADDVLAHAALVEVRLQQLRIQLLGPPQQRRGRRHGRGLARGQPLPNAVHQTGFGGWGLSGCPRRAAMAAIGSAAAVCDVTFGALRPALAAELVAALAAQGVARCTPVQAAAIPLFCSHKDVAVCATTGSGKTLAFLLPLLHILRAAPPLRPHQLGALVVSPTRELAAQILAVAEPLVAALDGGAFAAALAVGGTDVAASVARLARGDVRVLVATPGRLADVLDRCPSLDLRRVEVLVLDEADRLLDMGFRPQLAAILDRLPRQRRTGLFSATQPDVVQELMRAGLRNPVRVHVHAQAAPHGPGPAGAPPPSVADTASQTPSGLSIEYMICETTEKPSQLVHFLQQHKDKKLIVYFLTCACVDYWALALPLVLAHSCALPVFALHGKMKQRAREKVLADFSKLDIGALFCTDVAARGLDIPDVDWIVQFDPPQDPTSFVHRVGRTARMGKSGNALTFLLPKEESYVEFLGIRHVPVCPRSKATDIRDITSELRAAALKDRTVMETGLRAFVSFVRGYKEHHCNYIFRYKELDLGDLAIEFGLLQLPSMPELRKSKLKVSTRFQAIPSMDFNTISYKDKAREKQRQNNLEKAILTKASRKRPGTKGLTKVSESRYGGKKKAPSHRRDDVVGLDGDDDLEADYRLLQKLKRGVIDDEQFEEAVMNFARVNPDKKASHSSALGDNGASKVVVDSASPKKLASYTPSFVHNSYTDSLQTTSRKHSQKKIR